MPYIPPEVVAQAREMDLLTYLRTYEPQELVHFGGSTYCTREHDSLKISNGKWCWFSRGIGGYSALDYLIKVKEMPFTQAVETIMGNLAAAPPAFAPAPKAPKEKVLLLPQVNRSATHAVEYLHRRGIDYELIDFCIKTGRLYIRKEYSRSLLELSIEKSTLGVPMAFAEGNPKERIKNVMKSNTKKIIGFAGLGAVILIVVIAICLIPNRPQYATAKDAITGIPAIATQSATYAAIKTADGNTTITDSEGFNQLLNFIEGIEVNTKEVKRGSWNDSEGNNKITFYRADNSMDSVISFTSDYSKIWIETNATLSFTYSVKDPAEVQKGLAAFLGNNS